MEIGVKNKSGLRLLTNYKLRRISQCVLEPVARDRGYRNAEVSVVFVDNEEMQNLNRLYRKEDKTTDVIAFPMNSKRFDNIGPQILGDIVISLEQAVKQADEAGYPLEKELGLLLIHGFLHLLGYSDEKPADQNKMAELEDKYLELVQKTYSLWEGGKRIRKRRTGWRRS